MEVVLKSYLSSSPAKKEGLSMNAIKLGFALGAAMLASVGVANAQQVVKVGYAVFGAPLGSLTGATADNYRTLDPKGPTSGALIDLINAIAKDAGFQVQYEAMVAADLAAALTSNKIDVILSRPITSENKLVTDFSEPIYANHDVMYARRSDTGQYKSWQELKGAIIGAQRGSPLIDPLQKSGLFPEVKIYNSGDELRQAIINGEIKYAMDNSAIGDAIVLKQFPELRIVESYQPMSVFAAGFAVRKDESDLLKKINASLAKFKTDGTVRVIFTKYGTESVLVK